MIKRIYTEKWKIWKSELGYWFATDGSATLTAATRANLSSQIQNYGNKPPLPHKYQVDFSRGDNYKELDK